MGHGDDVVDLLVVFHGLLQWRFGRLFPYLEDSVADKDICRVKSGLDLLLERQMELTQDPFGEEGTDSVEGVSLVRAQSASMPNHPRGHLVEQKCFVFSCGVEAKSEEGATIGEEVDKDVEAWLLIGSH